MFSPKGGELLEKILFVGGGEYTIHIDSYGLRGVQLPENYNQNFEVWSEGPSLWRCRRSKRLSPLRSWLRFSLYRLTRVKKVSQRSVESHWFSPVSSHRES